MSNILKTKSTTFQEKITNSPLLPGCYLYKDKDGNVIYVGKAKILRNRLKSYFTNYPKLDQKTQWMINEACDVDYITVDSEVESLILETNLIKKYKTKFNILMRDDKNYIYVRFERQRKPKERIPTAYSAHQDFPRIFIVREKKDDGAEYFGPYPDSLPAKRILKKLRRLFPYRSTNNVVYEIDSSGKAVFSSNKKRCLYCHIGLCLGACAGLESKKDYNQRINNIKKFFKGEKLDIVYDLQSQIQKAAKRLEFEKAAELRDQLNDLKYISSNLKIDNSIDDILIDDLKKKEKNDALNELIQSLEFPPDKLKLHSEFKIECYDISNIQGTNAVGSMVVMVDGKSTPNLYRKFRIRMKNEPNDFAMLQEMLGRRLRRFLITSQNVPAENPFQVQSDEKSKISDDSFDTLPDLIIIDGGKGQLASTYKILYNFNLHNTIPIVGLAKKEEEIFKLSLQFKDEFNQINDSTMFKRIKLPKRSEALHLVQRIRDEAHRFGITYHRKLRSKGAIRE